MPSAVADQEQGLTSEAWSCNGSLPENGGTLAKPLLASSSDFEDGVTRRKGFGLIAMLGSAFLFSIMALQVKCLSQFGTFELVFWRSVFMFLGTTSFLFLRKHDLLGDRADWGILVFRGVAGFGFMSAFYQAIKMMPLSDAIVITYTSPVITGICAALILGEKWGRLDAIGSLLCFLGVIFISKPSGVMSFLGVSVVTSDVTLSGLGCALLSALLAASVYLLLRYAKHLDPMLSVNYFAVLGMILAPIFAYCEGEEGRVPQGTEWIQLGALAGLSVVGQALMNMGLAHESAGKATAMNYSQVVFAYVYQVFLFHKSSDMLSVVGAVLIASWGVFALMKESVSAEPPALHASSSFDGL